MTPIHLYDVIFEDEDSNIETVYERGSYIAAKCFLKSFRENFNIAGINYNLYIVPSGSHEVPHLKLVGKDKLEFPSYLFTMQAGKPPLNSDTWFNGFEEDKEFTAKSIYTAQLHLDALCEVSGTKSDPNWEKYGPTAVPVEEDVLDI